MTAPAAGPPPVPSFVRPMLALLAGLGVTVLLIVFGSVLLVVTMGVGGGAGALSQLWSPGFVAANVGLNLIAAGVGGYTAARLTSGRSMFTVVAIALILLVSGVASARKPRTGQTPAGPPWYGYVVASAGALGVLAGGLFARRRFGEPVRLH